MKPATLAEPVLVGRQSELEQLMRHLDSAVQGKGTTVFISGEAGSGKTRLTREFLNAAVKQGVAVMAGWCLSDSQAPFFPFIEAFNSYYAANSQNEQSINFQQPQLNPEVPTQIGVEEREVTSWLAGPKTATKTGKAEILSPQVWKDQALAAVAETVHTIALQAPVIIFIEDLHWADSASLALLHYLSRAVKDTDRILLLATFRSEELTADAEGHPHPLAETLRMMRREELFSEIKLPSLDSASVSKMAESMVGACIQPEFTEKLTVQSGGSPLFVVESLRMLNEHGGLVKDGACVRLDMNKVTIPSKVKDVILRRLGSLQREQRRVLDAASVIGEEFDVELLSTVLGWDYLEILETLDFAAHSTSLVRVEGNHYRFDHARSRETLYEELSLPLKRGYHNKIAEKLENHKNEEPRLSDMAYHYHQAGNREKAVRFALAAGKDELARWSNTQAIRHFQYVLQNIRDVQTEERNAALEGLGDAYAASYMYGEAMKTFDDLASPKTDDLKLRLRAIRKASDAAYRKGDEREPLLEYAKKAEELCVDDRLEMARIIDNRGKAWYWWDLYTVLTNNEKGLEDYDAALHVFEEENSLVDVAEALIRSGVSCFVHDYLREKGLSELLRAVAIFRELGDTRKETYALRMTGYGLWYNGLSEETRRVYANALSVGEKLDAFTELAYSTNYLSMIDEYYGNLGDALSKALRALEYSKKTDMIALQAGLNARLAALYGKLGDLKKADEYFDEVKKQPQEIRSSFAFRQNTYGAEIVYFASKGQWEDSKRFFEKGNSILEKFQSYGAFQPGRDIFLRGAFAWAFEKEGRFEDAKVQREIIQSLSEQVEARFGHTNVQFSILVQRKIQVEEVFEMRLDIVNVGRKTAYVVRVEGLTHPEFNFSQMPSFCNLKEGNIFIEDKTVGPFEVETLKLKLSATKAGNYVLNPEVFYLDDLGNTKTFKLDQITVMVKPFKPDYEVLPGRIPTGILELDRLLYGGIPEGYAVALVSPSSEERQRLIESYIEEGLKSNQATFCLTAEPRSAKALVEEYPSGMFLFVCNPRTDLMARDLPNIYRIKGVDNLTEIDIALTKASRQLTSSDKKRACIEIVSDVLLQHHAVITRKWLSALLQALKVKGFTTLAVIDPQMHPPEESRAIISLFDGEIAVTEKETAKGLEKTLRVRKLVNQKYLEDELTLTRKNLSS